MREPLYGGLPPEGTRHFDERTTFGSVLRAGAYLNMRIHIMYAINKYKKKETGRD